MPAPYDGAVSDAQRRTWPLVLAAIGLALTGCSGAPAASPTSSSTSTTSTPPPAPPPAEGACYTLQPHQTSRAHNHTDPVACRKKHTSQTYLVARLKRRTVGDPDAVHTERIARVAGERCSKALRSWLGGSREDRHLSRFEPVWFVPTPRQLNRGARWLRCDVVAYRTDHTLAVLPRTSEDILGQSEALATWGTCAQASQKQLNAGRGQRMCDLRHNWRAVSTDRLGKRSASWPGAGSVRADVLDRCEDDVRDSTDAEETEPVHVGWLPPTKRQWKAGQRYGLCWARTG